MSTVLADCGDFHTILSHFFWKLEFYPINPAWCNFIYIPNTQMEFYPFIRAKIKFHSFILKERYPLTLQIMEHYFNRDDLYEINPGSIPAQSVPNPCNSSIQDQKVMKKWSKGDIYSVMVHWLWIEHGLSMDWSQIEPFLKAPLCTQNHAI